MIGGLIKSSSRIALVAAAGVAFSGVAAKAADLGGDCCADLEERVAELEATTARKGNRKVSLTVYGQVNRAIMWHDLGVAGIDDLTIGRDNDGRSGSRFGFKGKAKINADLSAGFRIELAVDNNDDGADPVDERHTMVYIKSKSLGTIKLGRTSTATDGIAEIALASAVTPLSCEEFGDSGTPTDFACAAPGFDGSRDTGVHYVSPTFAGFSISGSVFHDSDADDHSAKGYDVALRYAGEFGAVRVAAGVGYSAVENADSSGDELTVLAGSASVMHVPSGVFLNAVVGLSEDESAAGGQVEETFGWYVSGGIKAKLNSLGATTFEVGYGMGDFEAANGLEEETSYFVAGVAQKIDAAAMDVYLNYQYNDAGILNNAGESNAVTAGARIKF